MRTIDFLLAALLCLIASTDWAEDVALLESKGIAALKLSQAEPDAVVTAAIYFGQASDAYQTAGNTEKATEMNSFLYWCKKKMTLAQMDAFLKGGDAINAAVAKRMNEVDTAPKADEAQTFFDRAKAYAIAHPNEHLLIAVRFYEVADRFKGTELSLQAQDRSLKEMTLEKSTAAAVNPARDFARQDAAADASKKIPQPSAAQLKEAEKTIKDLYKTELAQSAPKDKAALAAKMTKQADESLNDPAARYALLVQAAALAAQAGDFGRLMEALTSLTMSFEGNFNDVIKQQLSVVNPKLTDPRLTRAAAAVRVLIDKPDDPAASLTVGKYWLSVANVDRAATHILKSKQASWIELIKQEQAPPADEAARAALADAWWELSEKAADKDDKLLCRTRAAAQYQVILASLSGLARAKAEKRIAEFEAANPAGIVVNLLKLIDPSKDTVAGKWIFNNGALVTDNTKWGRIQIPYLAPEEYDFTVVFKRREGNDGVTQILTANGRQFEYSLGVWGNTYAGFEVIDNKYLKENSTGVEVSVPNDQFHTSTVKVRKDGASAFLNGKLITEWKTHSAFNNVTVFGGFKLQRKDVLGLVHGEGIVEFQRIELIEITGRGRPLRN
jgi:hypothetical protein